MSLTQEKSVEKNFNNNDHHDSYLHKKFKRMASTVATFPSSNEGPKFLEANAKEIPSSSNISNECIATAHPEIEKIKGKLENQSSELFVKSNVQTNCSVDEDTRIRNVNNISQVSGQTSFSDEFQYKTENIENDLTKETYNGGASGRHICPYCKLSCAKPSVLQKHIRAHTNERPYPCLPCGFAFKTKSNLYKHRRSRTHALRLQGADVPASINEEELSGESESDTSVPSNNYANDLGFERRLEDTSYNENSSQVSDGSVSPSSLLNENRFKSIYKPKFRVASFSENEERIRLKRSLSHNADFLNEHISKIISDNEAIVDVIDTPLQKKYNKIKQIAESKQFSIDGHDFKNESSPLNLTKQMSESDSNIRKRLHPENLSLTDLQKHPLNPEGSIIKDLLLKTKANGFTSVATDVDGLGNLYICNLCQIMYRSEDNLAIHKLYYCKGGSATGQINLIQKDKTVKPEFSRSISLSTRISETAINHISNYDKVIVSTVSPPVRNKPDNLIIMRNDCNDVATPLPSPGPLLGNTRLVDSRTTNDFKRKSDVLVLKQSPSPKRSFESISETHSPIMIDNLSPRSIDLYPQPKVRCLEPNTGLLRPIEDLPSHMRHNSASLQMFGGEVKIMDHSGSTTTLRIEPSKNQLSPILIHQNISPTKFAHDTEASSVVVRSDLHSGGTIVHNPPTPKETVRTPHQQTSKIFISNSSMNPTPTRTRNHDVTHFQFPPFNAITAFNPLTLPPLPQMSPNGPTTIIHGGKLIPHVPGIPGPNSSNITLSSNMSKLNNTQNISEDQLVFNSKNNSAAPSRRYSNASTSDSDKDLKIRNSTVPIIKVKDVDESHKRTFYLKSPSDFQETVTSRKSIDIVSKLPTQKDVANVTIKAKLIDKSIAGRSTDSKSETEIRNFNFENLITKAEIYSGQISCTPVLHKNNPGTSSIPVSNERSETAYFQKNVSPKPGSTERKANFLRPSTLPLKPGTFTPKRHHGITPNANTMPLVSPETPRPAKAFGQLYLNGNAYTYLGLKCSTKVFYCTINRPQPTYVPNQHFLSMYSNWQLLSELTPDPLGLSAPSAMSLYDSRHRPQNVAIASIKHDLILTHSSQWNQHCNDKKALSSIDAKKVEEKSQQENVAAPKKELAGGFESNEEYTYVRGRGRGRYVCSECGIRCKKPSMLKKHIRTHTDVRPYTCVHCAFSFKTKGNLTKHMKSKSHYKKCCELGINPNEGNEAEGSEAMGSGETDDETDSDGDELNEGETESSDTEVNKSRLPEHEAAHCLLSLGNTRPSTSTTPGLITSARPSTYPYTPITLESLTDIDQDKMLTVRNNLTDKTIEPDINEPMDLSKNDVKPSNTIPEIPTARESSVLASLASNTAKLPQHQTQWVNGEPMLHATYLTERALLDSKIKQSQYTMSKLRKIELKESLFNESTAAVSGNYEKQEQSELAPDAVSSETSAPIAETESPIALKEETTSSNNPSITTIEFKRSRTTSANTESVKNVVSEYLARINLISAQENVLPSHLEIINDNNGSEEQSREEQPNNSENESSKGPNVEHDPVARKVVIGAGGVAFKVSSAKDFDGSVCSTSRLLDDGRRVCDFCNKSFTKPSQLRLHLNIHYMERPFRCSACAVSFRTRGHLQKHERSGSHHNKVSMTSTFGAATSLNPRPFRCSDCNIAFRIHGHLAKHLRSKMHVMRLECLFKLPFGTFTEIERAGLSLTDIDTTDCESSLASLQSLARKLHEKDPSKLEYREPNSAGFMNHPYLNKGSSEDEDGQISVISVGDSEKHDGNIDPSINDHMNLETRTTYSATDI